MPSTISSIWRRMPADIISRTENCIRAAEERLEGWGSGSVFFRADDVAVPGRRVCGLLELFRRNRAPLCPAVVPAWLTAGRWRHLKGAAAKDPSLCCWHQHGWRHVNHEISGKKQEFGPARGLSEIKSDLLRGKQRLEELMKADFYPVFTPPWNRCSDDALRLLPTLGYAAVSRDCGSASEAPSNLADFCINVDLHTRRDRDSVSGWNDLFYELQQAISSSYCGIMIHHQRMNAAAFDFLALLLKILTRAKTLRLIQFRDLAEK